MQASAKLDRPATRKQTRGGQVKRSVHVTGGGKRGDTVSSDSDSDTEQDTGKTSRKTLATNIFRPRPQFPAIERRQCPVSGCDSAGHLSGRLERHFTAEACPVYHNTTSSACRAAVAEYNKKDAARKKALSHFSSKSPLTSPTSDHRQEKYYLVSISCNVISLQEIS